MSEPIALAADHGGVEIKTMLAKRLAELGYRVVDLGTHTADSVDYPDFADKLAAALKAGEAARGVLICGSGIGISIAANRHRHIRAALVHGETEARLCRQHNDANVIVFGGRTLGPEIARAALSVFMSTAFEGGRHARRVAKMG